MLFVQTWLLQSSLTMQALRSSQSAQSGPPQSTAVSVPFFTESMHVCAWQTLPPQTLLMQSFAVLHELPFGQSAAQTGPPQSVPVSLPFLTPSLHAGSLQINPSHTPLTQSLGALHFLPEMQRAMHTRPPQSMSV